MKRTFGKVVGNMNYSLPYIISQEEDEKVDKKPKITPSKKISYEYFRKTIGTISDKHLSLLEKKAEEIVGKAPTQRKLNKLKKVIKDETRAYTRFVKELLGDSEVIESYIENFKIGTKRLYKTYRGKNE